jgi:hypothetical protein
MSFAKVGSKPTTPEAVRRSDSSGVAAGGGSLDSQTWPPGAAHVSSLARPQPPTVARSLSPRALRRPLSATRARPMTKIERDSYSRRSAVGISTRTATGLPTSFRMLHSTRYDVTRAFADMMDDGTGEGGVESMAMRDYRGSELAERERRKRKLSRLLRLTMTSHEVLAVGDWKDLFRRYDRDDSGSLDFDEFKKAVRRGANVSEREMDDVLLKELFGHIDVDGGGSIDPEELHGFLECERRSTDPNRTLGRRDEYYQQPGVAHPAVDAAQARGSRLGTWGGQGSLGAMADAARSAQLHAPKASIAASSARKAAMQPWVAEWVTLERLVVREGPELSSLKVCNRRPASARSLRNRLV